MYLVAARTSPNPKGGVTFFLLPKARGWGWALLRWVGLWSLGLWGNADVSVYPGPGQPSGAAQRRRGGPPPGGAGGASSRLPALRWASRRRRWPSSACASLRQATSVGRARQTAARSRTRPTGSGGSCGSGSRPGRSGDATAPCIRTWTTDCCTRRYPYGPMASSRASPSTPAPAASLPAAYLLASTAPVPAAHRQAPPRTCARPPADASLPLMSLPPPPSPPRAVLPGHVLGGPRLRLQRRTLLHAPHHGARLLHRARRAARGARQGA
jgi:hypothetical protein